LLEEAKPVVAYVIDVVTQGLDMQDGKAKAAAVQQVLPLINDVADPVEREHYRQMLARRLKVDERVLHTVSIPTGRKRAKANTPQTETVRPAGPDSRDVETTGLTMVMRGKVSASEMRREDFLRQCLAYPKIMAQIDKQLAVNQQSVVSEADFTRLDDKVLWRQIREQQSHWPVAATEDLWDSLEDEYLRDRVQILLAMPETAESELDRLPDRLVLSVLDWRLERVKSLMDEVEKLFREMQAQDNPELLNLYRQQLRELPLQLLSINKARGAMSATGKRDAGEKRDYRRNPQ
jgi:DNA primase